MLPANPFKIPCQECKQYNYGSGAERWWWSLAEIWMEKLNFAMAGEQEVNKKSGSHKQVIQF